MTKVRTTRAVPTVEAELPTPTAVPRNLLPTLLWTLGTAVAVTALWVAIITIRDHNAAAEKDHDAKFVKTEEMKTHEREDITAIRGLTDAINNLAVTADQSRQYVLLSNKRIESSVADLVSRQCRKDNSSAKDVGYACEKEIRAADTAAKQVDAQSDKANTATTKAQTLQIVPPARAP
jgi:hypothetical protein